MFPDFVRRAAASVLAKRWETDWGAALCINAICGGYAELGLPFWSGRDVRRPTLLPRVQRKAVTMCALALWQSRAGEVIRMYFADTGRPLTHPILLTFLLCEVRKYMGGGMLYEKRDRLLTVLRTRGITLVDTHMDYPPVLRCCQDVALHWR